MLPCTRSLFVKRNAHPADMVDEVGLRDLIQDGNIKRLRAAATFLTSQSDVSKLDA